jgi:hypothetical protein
LFLQDQYIAPKFPIDVPTFTDIEKDFKFGSTDIQVKKFDKLRLDNNILFKNNLTGIDSLRKLSAPKNNIITSTDYTVFFLDVSLY